MMNILEEAQQTVDGPRKKEYGDKHACFTKIGQLWGAYLGVEIKPSDVAHLMIILKVVRNMNNYKRDSMVDVAGYAYCADLIHQYENPARYVGE